MSRTTTSLLKAALSAMHYSGADSLMAPWTRGQGVVFMLHHVRPEPPQSFEPNRILKITPEFLDTVISQVLAAGFEVVTLDQAADRLEQERAERPFACFTFDDGYRDNRDYALPVFRRHGVPFTLYVPSNYPGGGGDLWWLTLEDATRKASSLTLTMDGAARTFETRDDGAKHDAFQTIYWWLRRLPEREARAQVANIARQAGHDPSTLCSDIIMTWDEIRELAKDPLVTIGAHTCNHMALAKLSEDEARQEMAGSVRRIEAELGQPCRHFSYPYGDATSAGPREFRLAREIGMRTAVTTDKGVIHAHHKAELTALPRLSLNGDYQDPRLVKVLMSGAPFALINAAKRLMRPRAAA